MKPIILIFPLAVLLAGCSTGSETSTSDGATAKDNFSRPMTDAEKAAGGAGATGQGGVPAGAAAPPDKS